MAIFYLDPANGNDASDGTSWANAWKTISSGPTAARIAPGDTIRIAKTSDPVNSGVTATLTYNSPNITLSSALNKDIETCATSWTASTNVTSTTNTTDYQEGSQSTDIAIGASFTTGMAAYKSMASNDLSAYQQVSLWVRTSVAIAANTMQLNLCSDSAGATPVHTFTFPAMSALNVWFPIVFDNGSALNNAIQSVSISFLLDPGTPTITLDNIIAAKAPSDAGCLTHQMLISSESAAQTDKEYWYPLKSIRGTTIKLQNQRDSTASTSGNYFGTTKSNTAIYTRLPFQMWKNQQTSSQQVVQDSGSETGGFITFSGGWNTSNSTQDGESHWMGWGSGSSIYGTYVSDKPYVSIERIGYHCFQTPLLISSSAAGTGLAYNQINRVYCTASASNGGVSLGTSYSNRKIKALNCCFFVRCRIFSEIQEIEGCDFFGSTSSSPINIEGTKTGSKKYKNCNIKMNQYGAYVNTDVSFYNCSFSDNTSGDIWGTSLINSVVGTARLYNCLLSSANEIVSSGSIAGFSVYSSNHDQVAGAVKQVIGGVGTILSQNSIRHTASGIAYSIAPTTVLSVYNPLEFKLATIAVNANALVTVKVWMRRTNTGLSMDLYLPSYQIAGVTSEVSSSITAIADTWEEVSITFTPTESGVVTVYVRAYGGTTYTGYLDDITVTQA